jgi:acylphosphatase
MSKAKRTVHMRITGRVQGVGFRAWAAERAKEHRLAGWVRNRRDGSVEAFFHGAPAEIAAMIGECAHGPTHAQVSAAEIIGETAAAEPDGFSILPTI